MPFNVELMGKYKTNYFIETGTHGGQGVKNALGVGYPNVRSVEIDLINYNTAVEELKDYPNVKLYLGDSREKLWEMIADINEQVTFWLDAHGSTDPDIREKYGRMPMIGEIEAIQKHPIKNHYILIDDLHSFDKYEFDFVQIEKIKEMIKEINPEYKFEIAGVRGEILIAYV